MSFSPELISGFIAFILTLLVFFYLLGDNFLFRATIYIFVGVSAGYIAAVAWHQVLLPQLFLPLISGSGGERTLAFIPLILTILLLAKAFPPFSKMGAPAVAFIVGVGAAVAIGGAVTGTLFPQTQAAIDAFDLQSATGRDVSPITQLVEGGILLLGTISALVYFQFSAKRRDDGKRRRNPLVETLAFIGRVFIAITFGALFAGVYTAALTALIERLNFLWTFIGSL